jgi:hypothetical protein
LATGSKPPQVLRVHVSDPLQLPEVLHVNVLLPPLKPAAQVAVQELPANVLPQL